MSMNRDNYRANQPPSKVLHVRKLPPEASEADLIELCKPFGRVLRVKLLGHDPKHGPGGQAFVEFDSMRSTIQMISYFAGGAEQPQVLNKNVFLQYSTRQDISGSATLVAAPPPASGTGPVLLASLECLQPALGPNIDHLFELFSAHGPVAKIVVSEPARGGLQALVQYRDASVTPGARLALDGTQLPLHMAPRHPGPVVVRVVHSPLADVPVRQQTAHARDYTSSGAPWAAGAGPGQAPGVQQQQGHAQQQAGAGAAAGADREDGYCVLLAMLDDVQYTPTLDALAQVFSVYGPLAKMLLMNKAGMWQALVQYKTAAGAAAAKQYLDGHAMYPGGANRIQVEFSMQRDLVVPSNDEHGWDWTDPAERAAAAAAKEAAESQAAGLAASWGGDAAAGDGGGDSGGGGGGGTQVDVGDEPQKEAAAGAAGSAPGEGYVPSGLDFVRAHEEVARMARAALGRQSGGDGGGEAGA